MTESATTRRSAARVGSGPAGAYVIRADALGALRERIARAARRQGVPGPVLLAEPLGGDRFRVSVQPAGETRVGDYQLVGTVDHRGARNQVRALARLDLSSYAAAPAACDHCGTERRRNETFVLQGRDGSLRQVGRNCLREYVGAPSDGVRDLLATADLFGLAMRTVEEWDEQGRGGERRLHLPTLLAYAAESSMADGWVSAKAGARSGQTPTYQRALAEMPPDGAGGVVPREAATAVARRALDWVRALPSQDDAYLEKVRGVCAEELISVSEAGLATSVLWAYRERSRLRAEAGTAEAEERPREPRREWGGDEYQRAAVEVEVRRLAGKDRGLNAAIGLVRSAGEAADLVRRDRLHGETLDRELLGRKAGDALWYLAITLDDCGIALADVMGYNLRRLRARHASGGEPREGQAE